MFAVRTAGIEFTSSYLAPGTGHARRGAPLQLAVHPLPGASRTAVEQFIRTVYRDGYGATVRTFAPTLVALQRGDEVVAAAGYRSATRPLFLERYLQQPVERCLGDAAGLFIPRERIVEVGHLASVRNGAGRLLMPFLGRHLAEAGFEWVVSTATEELAHLFDRLGLAPLVLGAADPAMLGAEAADWGSYYDHSPQVLAGSIAAGLAQLTQARR